MKIKPVVFVGLILSTLGELMLTGCEAATAPQPQVILPPMIETVQWARSAGGTTESFFSDVAVDDESNVVAVGDFVSPGTLSFGDGVSVVGSASAGKRNPIIVKYDKSGVAQWARTTVSGLGEATFYSVSIDQDGNIYVAGATIGTETFEFGDGVSVTGVNDGNYASLSGAGFGNLLLVKYDKAGVVQWARTMEGGSGRTILYGVASDRSGSLYAVGYVDLDAALGEGVHVTSTVVWGHTEGYFVAKYRDDGVPLWAKQLDGLSVDPLNSPMAVECDSEGNFYIVGNGLSTGLVEVIPGTYPVYFGNNVTLSLKSSGNPQAFLAKYNASGEAQWARKPVGSTGHVTFSDLAVGSSGPVVVGRFEYMQDRLDLENDVVLDPFAWTAPLVAKYGSDGTALWGRTLAASVNGYGSGAAYYGVGLDALEQVVVVGETSGSGIYNFGNGVLLRSPGNEPAESSQSNGVLVKYSSEGQPLSAQTQTAGSKGMIFSEASVDSGGFISVVGGLVGTAEFGFGNGQSVTGGATGWNLLVARYE